GAVRGGAAAAEHREPAPQGTGRRRLGGVAGRRDEPAVRARPGRRSGVAAALAGGARAGGGVADGGARCAAAGERARRASVAVARLLPRRGGGVGPAAGRAVRPTLRPPGPARAARRAVG